MIKDFLEQFLFFPNKDIKKNPSILNLEYKDVFVNHNQDKYHGWYLKGNYKNSITENKCILFFHGNAGNISFRLNYIEKFYELGFSIMIFDYPGFGFSTGIPTENSCIQSANLFYQYLINEEKYISNNIIFYGESIGGSIAASLSNIYNIKYLILQSTFTDIKEIIKNIISFNIFMNDYIGFETLEKLKIRFKLNKLNKKMKSFVIHSNDDELIDINHLEKLSKFADQKYICTGSHSNINIDPDFIFNLLSFIKE